MKRLELVLDVANVETFSSKCHHLFREVGPVFGEGFGHVLELASIPGRIAKLHYFQPPKQLVVRCDCKVAFVDSVRVHSADAQVPNPIFLRLPIE